MRTPLPGYLREPMGVPLRSPWPGGWEPRDFPALLCHQAQPGNGSAAGSAAEAGTGAAPAAAAGWARSTPRLREHGRGSACTAQPEEPARPGQQELPHRCAGCYMQALRAGRGSAPSARGAQVNTWQPPSHLALARWGARDTAPRRRRGCRRQRGPSPSPAPPGCLALCCKPGCAGRDGHPHICCYRHRQTSPC